MPSQWIKDIYESSLPKLRVVSVGTLPELLSLRHAVLEGAGFQVLSTSKLEEALLRIENGTCGVLLLCYSLDDDILRRLATQFSKSCPDGRIVTITNRPLVIPPIQADAFAYAVESSEALIAAVRGDTRNKTLRLHFEYVFADFIQASVGPFPVSQLTVEYSRVSVRVGSGYGFALGA